MAELAQPRVTSPTDARKLATAYIPGEAIAVYIAALGTLVPTAAATADQIGRVRLVCFIAGLAVALVIAYVSFDPTDVIEKREVWRRRMVVAALAAFSFGIYAAATPSFFYTDTYLTVSVTQWAAFAALVSTAVLPEIAKRLGVRNMGP